MMKEQKRYFLTEDQLPRQWYNIQAEMVNKPLPLLDPKTRQPLTADDLSVLFAKECAKQELDTEHAWIDIPEEVQRR